MAALTLNPPGKTRCRRLGCCSTSGCRALASCRQCGVSSRLTWLAQTAFPDERLSDCGLAVAAKSDEHMCQRILLVLQLLVGMLLPTLAAAWLQPAPQFRPRPRSGDGPLVRLPGGCRGAGCQTIAWRPCRAGGPRPVAAAGAHWPGDHLLADSRAGCLAGSPTRGHSRGGREHQLRGS